jgi:hypothetical protein
MLNFETRYSKFFNVNIPAKPDNRQDSIIPINSRIFASKGSQMRAGIIDTARYQTRIVCFNRGIDRHCIKA